MDAHCHLDFAAFDADRDGVMARSRSAGIVGHVIAGYSPESARGALRLRSESVRVCVGLHPWALVGTDESTDAARIDALAALVEEQSGAIDGIGEIGVDAALARSEGVSLERQLRVAREGLALALRANKPVVLHVVGAHEAMLPLVDARVGAAGVMVHAFSASRERMTRWLARGAMLSFGRAVLDPRARHVQESMREIPLDRLLVESDATGGHHATGARRDPRLLLDVIRAIAAARGEPPEVIACTTRDNARRLFGGFGR